MNFIGLKNYKDLKSTTFKRRNAKLAEAIFKAMNLKANSGCNVYKIFLSF